MTPKEKAIELVIKYQNLVNGWNCYSDTEIVLEDKLPDMKKCALIAVDEILDLLRILEINNSYYLEVKTEIEKLK